MTPGGHLLGIGAAAAAALAWSALTYFIRMALREGPLLRTTAAVNALNALLVTLAALAYLPPEALLPAGRKTLLYVLLAGTLHIGISRLFFYGAIQRIGPSRCIPIAMSYPIVTAFLAALWLGEPLTLRIASGLALLLGGITLIARARPPAGEAGGAAPAPGRALGWAFAALTSILWGVAAVFFKRASLSLHPLAVSTLALWVGAAVAFLIDRGGSGAGPRLRIPRRAWPWILAASACQAVAVPFYNVAFTLTLAVRVTAIVSAQPLLVILIGWLFLREAENITPRLTAGALLTVAGTLVVVS